MTASTIGALRDRLTLEQSVRVDDGGGGAAISWQTVAELWASIQPMTGDERLIADAISGRVTHAITLRHRSGIGPAMRLRDASRIFEIVAVLDAGRGNRLKCLCEERHL